MVPLILYGLLFPKTNKKTTENFPDGTVLGHFFPSPIYEREKTPEAQLPLSFEGVSRTKAFGVFKNLAHPA